MKTKSKRTVLDEQHIQLWEKHTRSEFSMKSVDETMATMCPNPHINNIPTMMGGVGFDAVRQFYSQSFIHQLPEDTENTLISRTIGETQIVDELIFKFTHTMIMDWILPGIPPTGLPVEIALVVIIGFKDQKISHEHIYWDQACVLEQIGLLSKRDLPITGVESARKILAQNQQP